MPVVSACINTGNILYDALWGNVYVYKAARPDGMLRQVPESIDVFAAELLVSEEGSGRIFQGLMSLLDISLS